MPTGTVPATHVAGWAEGLTVLPQSWPASDGALRRPPTWPARVGRGAWRPAALPHTKEHVQWSVGQVAALSCTLGLLALWVVRWLRTPKRPSLLVPIDFYSAIYPSQCALQAVTGEVGPPHSSPQIGIVGGGPAGYFAAIRAAELTKGKATVTVYEAGGDTLRKVRLSGGGRCNVMHDPFDPNKSVRRITRGDPNVDPTEPFNPAYPRGGSMLCGLMTATFGPQDMHTWFTRMGVALKTEPDGRVFPQSDRSEDVVAALEEAARQADVRVRLRHRLVQAEPRDEGGVDLRFGGVDGAVRCDAVVFAPGADRQCLRLIETALRHRVVPPVPSLFAFGLDRSAGTRTLSVLAGAEAAALSGLTLPWAGVRLEPAQGPPGDAARAALKALQRDPNAVRRGGLAHVGPVVFTHEGLSGPAALRLSAFAARALHAAGWGSFDLVLNVLLAAGLRTVPAAEAALLAVHAAQARDRVHAVCPFTDDDGQRVVPLRLWRYACTLAGVDEQQNWAEVSKAKVRDLAEVLVASRAAIMGKAINKDEFVTSGGVELQQLDPKNSLASHVLPGVFFAGEVLDCDAVTGGFSFQICWATGFAAGTGAANFVLRKAHTL
eukprot:EG_transcript_6085